MLYYSFELLFAFGMAHKLCEFFQKMHLLEEGISDVVLFSDLYHS